MKIDAKDSRKASSTISNFKHALASWEKYQLLDIEQILRAL